MLSDFYFRAQDDPNFVEGLPVIHNEIEEAIYQTKMTLLTNKGEVLGEPNFGFNAEDYLFELGPINPNVIEGRASAQLNDYATAAKKYGVSVKPFLLQFDDARDALGVDIKMGTLGSFGVLFG